MEHLPVTVKSGTMGMCGFCTWPTHAHGPHIIEDERLDPSTTHCPVGVLTQNGTLVLKCECVCSRNLIKCFDCGVTQRADDKGGEVNPKTWRCIDPDGCQARIQKRLAADPMIQQIREARARASESTRETRVARAKATTPARPNAGKCLHCGEPTKGGLFLPGHDSSFLAAAARDINERKRTLEEVTLDWEQLGTSEALRAKLAKRVSK